MNEGCIGLYNLEELDVELEANTFDINIYYRMYTPLRYLQYHKKGLVTYMPLKLRLNREGDQTRPPQHR